MSVGTEAEVVRVEIGDQDYECVVPDDLKHVSLYIKKTMEILGRASPWDVYVCLRYFGKKSTTYRSILKYFSYLKALDLIELDSFLLEPEFQKTYWRIKEENANDECWIRPHICIYKLGLRRRRLSPDYVKFVAEKKGLKVG